MTQFISFFPDFRNAAPENAFCHPELTDKEAMDDKKIPDRFLGVALRKAGVF